MGHITSLLENISTLWAIFVRTAKMNQDKTQQTETKYKIKDREINSGFL